MYDLGNTPKGKFQVLRNGSRSWDNATVQEVTEALHNYSMRPADDYNDMIRYAYTGDPKCTIRLGDDYFRFYPFGK